MAMTSERRMYSGVMLPSPQSVIPLSDISTMRCRAYLALEISASTTSPMFSVSGAGSSSALSLPSSSHGLMLYPLSGSVTVCPSLMSFAISGIKMSLLMCRERFCILLLTMCAVYSVVSSSWCFPLWQRWSDRSCRVFLRPTSLMSTR